MREGIEPLARPDGVLGERGLMGGGAAGHELDRADTGLGTPHDARGAVFSVGSMCFIGALPFDGDTNVAAKLVGNVVRPFVDLAPFLAPFVTAASS